MEVDTLSADARYANPGRNKSSVFRSLITSKSHSTPPGPKSKLFSRKADLPPDQDSAITVHNINLQLPPDHPAAVIPLHEPLPNHEQGLVHEGNARPAIASSSTPHRSSKKRVLASPGLSSPGNKTSRRKITPPEKENIIPEGSVMSNSPTKSLTSLASPEIKTRRWFGKGSSRDAPASATTPSNGQVVVNMAKENDGGSDKETLVEPEHEKRSQAKFGRTDMPLFNGDKRGGSAELNASLEALLVCIRHSCYGYSADNA